MFLSSEANILWWFPCIAGRERKANLVAEGGGREGVLCVGRSLRGGADPLRSAVLLGMLERWSGRASREESVAEKEFWSAFPNFGLPDLKTFNKGFPW